MSDAEKVQQLNTMGVTMDIVGDVMTLSFRNGQKEDWLAVSPMLLEQDAWKVYESIRFGGRTWVKVEGGIQ